MQVSVSLEEHERKLIEQVQTIHQTLDILRNKIDYYRFWEDDISREGDRLESIR